MSNLMETEIYWDEVARLRDAFPLISEEACQMIAYNNLDKTHEN